MFKISGHTPYSDSEDMLNLWRMDVLLKTCGSVEVEPPSSTIRRPNESTGTDQQAKSDPFGVISTVIHAMTLNSTDPENSLKPSNHMGEQLLDKCRNPVPDGAAKRSPIIDVKSVTNSTRPSDAPVPFRRQTEQSVEPRHDDYFTYMKLQNHLAYEIVTFFIQGRIENGDESYPGTGAFEVTYLSSSLVSSHVLVKPDPLSSSRYICSFMAMEPGAYKINVKLLLPEPRHINGSPLQVIVSRNYGKSRPLITIPPARTKAKKLPVRSQPPFKCWGIDADLFSEMIYMINKEANTVKILSMQGVKFAQFGNQENGEKLNRPTGIVVDAINSRVIISDKNNHRICFWSLGGEFIKSFGKRGEGDGEFCYPWGVAVSPDGIFIAVADSRNHRVQIFDKYGNFLRKFSDIAAAANSFESKHDLRTPCGICFDKTGGNIYVSDYHSRAVYVIDLDLTQKKTFFAPTSMLRPQGMTVDKAGNVLICDSKTNCVQVVTPDGSLLCKISGDVQFNPQDIAILRDGLVAVLDVNGTIRIY